jgi:hypothetical protein
MRNQEGDLREIATAGNGIESRGKRVAFFR